MEAASISARGVAGHFEEPGTKQLVIPYLCSLSINREHHFLGQILGDAGLVPSFLEEGNQGRRENTERVAKGIFVGLIQKLFGDFKFSRVPHECVPSFG